MNDELLITKDNYKGYIDLYNIKTNHTDRYKTVNGILNLGIPLSVYILCAISTIIPFSAFLILFPIFLISEIGLIFFYIVKGKKIKEISLIKLKKEYPYVNEKISLESLSSALYKANILKKVGDGVFSDYIADKESYEKSIELQKSKSKSENFMDNFVPKLDDKQFDRSELEFGEEFNPSPEFIDQTINNYQKLLELGLIPSFEEEISEEKGPKLVKRNNNFTI